MQRPSHNTVNGLFQTPFIVPVFIPHCGCPHRCVFCNQETITATKTADLTPTDIRERIKAFLKFRRDARQQTQISFYGGNFLGLPPKNLVALLEVADTFVRSENADSIRFSTRPDTIRPETLALVRGYPVATVEIGVQSMDDDVLQNARRGHSADHSRTAVRLLQTDGFEVGVQMMIGLPGETRDSAVGSAKQIAALHPDFVRIYPTIVMADSLLENWYRTGRYQPLSLEDAVTTAKLVKHIFDGANIPIVRIGLQATPELCQNGNIVAGPWHPSFGQLVQSESFLDLASAKLSKFSNCRDKTAVFRLHPKSQSAFRGLKNMNIHALKKRFRLASILVREDATITRKSLTVSVNDPGPGTP